MDFDSLVRTVLGEEGAPRYMRLGIILTVAGLVLIVAILALPMFRTTYSLAGTGNIEEDSWTYFQMRDDRVMWASFLDQINMSLAAFVLLTLFGVVLVMEGLGKIELRKLLRWDSEVRATALYAVATALAFIGLLGMASIWGMTLHSEQWKYNDMEYREDVSSPAGAVVTGLGLVLVLGLLFMTVYSVTLAAYRNGLHPKARTLGRIAVAMALVSLVGVLALRLGGVLVYQYAYEFGVPGDMYYFDGVEPITYLEADLLAHHPDAAVAVERFDLFLGVMNWALVLSTLASLAATVGISAMGKGGRSRRVLMATSLPAAVVLFGIVAIASGVLAASYANQVAEGLVPDLGRPVVSMDLSGTASLGVYLTLGLSLVVTLFSAVYVKVAGRPVLLAALGTVPAPEPEVVPAVDAAEGEPGVAADEGAPGGAPSPTLSRPVGLGLLLVAVIIIAVSAGAFMLRGGGDGDGGNGGTQSVDIESLEEFSLTFSVDSYLTEGSTEIQDIQVQFTDLYCKGPQTYFVDGITATLTWVDEPDRQNPLATYENQPDTFGLTLVDGELTMISMTDAGSNSHGGEGVVTLQWISDYRWIAWGNESIDADEGYTVFWHLNVDANVDMMEAGNMVAPRRPIAYTDGGNEYTLEVTVTGRVHGPEPL